MLLEKLLLIKIKKHCSCVVFLQSIGAGTRTHMVKRRGGRTAARAAPL